MTNFDAIDTSTDSITIGALKGGSNEFNGSISRPIIFNVALSADEVSSLYNGTYEAFYDEGCTLHW